jgi:hypothetical protein
MDYVNNKIKEVRYQTLSKKHKINFATFNIKDEKWYTSFMAEEEHEYEFKF